jgi:hypothetical protein
LENLKQAKSPLYTALRLTHPIFEDDSLTLCFEFPLHQKKIQQAKNKQLLASVIEEVIGQKVRIECLVDKSYFKVARSTVIATKSQNDDPPNSLKAISNIFGSAEMLES